MTYFIVYIISNYSSYHGRLKYNVSVALSTSELHFFQKEHLTNAVW